MGFQSWLEAAPPARPSTCDRRASTDACRPSLARPQRGRCRRSSSTASASPRWSRGSPTCASALDLTNGALGLLLLVDRGRLGARRCRPAGALIERSGRRRGASGWAPCCAPLGLAVAGVGVARARRRCRSPPSACSATASARRLGRRDERRGRRGRAAARPHDHAALPRRLQLRHGRRRRARRAGGRARRAAAGALRASSASLVAGRWRSWPSAAFLPPSGARPRRSRRAVGRSAWLEPRTLADRR